MQFVQRETVILTNQKDEGLIDENEDMTRETERDMETIKVLSAVL
jgi:hypothetical protein